MAQNTPFQFPIKAEDTTQSCTHASLSPLNTSVSGPSSSNSPQQQNNQKLSLDWDDIDDKDEDESDNTNAERQRRFSKELRLTLFGYGG